MTPRKRIRLKMTQHASTTTHRRYKRNLLDDEDSPAGPSGSSPKDTAPPPPDYALPLAQEDAEQLLATVVTGSRSLGTAFQRLEDKRSKHAATTFLRYCINHWPEVHTSKGAESLYDALTASATVPLLPCLFKEVAFGDKLRTAEAAAALHELSYYLSADSLLLALLDDGPWALRWLLLSLADVEPLELYISGSHVPFPAATEDDQAIPLADVMITRMVATASADVLGMLISRLSAPIQQQHSTCAGPAAMLLDVAATPNPAGVQLLLEHLDGLVTEQLFQDGRTQDHILQAIAAVARTVEGFEVLTACDLAPLISTMSQPLSVSCLSPGIAVDIIATRLVHSAAGRLALIDYVDDLAKVCEEHQAVRSLAVSAAAVRTLRLIALDSGIAAGYKAVQKYSIGPVMKALASFVQPRSVKFWSVGAVEEYENHAAQSIMDLAVEDAAAMLREFAEPIGARTVALKKGAVPHFRHALLGLFDLGMVQPLKDLCHVVEELGDMFIGQKALAETRNLDALLHVACSSSLEIAAVPLLAVYRIAKAAAMGEAAAAAGQLETPARRRNQAVADLLVDELASGHMKQLLSLTRDADLAYLAFACIGQLLQTSGGRTCLACYAEVLQQIARDELPGLPANAVGSRVAVLNPVELLYTIQESVCVAEVWRHDSLVELEAAAQDMNHAVADFAEVYVAYHTLHRCDELQQLVEMHLQIVRNAVDKRQRAAGRVRQMQPRALLQAV